MARARRSRWKGWRVEEGGRNVRSDPDYDKTEREARRRTQKRRKGKRRDSWWWTLAGRDSACDNCGEGIAKGEIMAFRADPARILCTSCAASEGVDRLCRESRRLREAKRGD